MPSVALTAGRLTALWLVLRSLERLGGNAAPGELHGYASRSALRLGALPIADGLRLGLEGALLQESTGRYELTDIGRAALTLGAEDDPSTEARRFFVSILLLTDPPPWVAYWQGDATALQLVIPEAERRILLESGLLPQQSAAVDLPTWAFWQALGRVPLVAETAARRKVIGDAGEALSVAHERARLRDEGRPDLALRVQWLSRESDAYGFDILSFAGREGDVPDQPIAIEVKSSSLPRGTALHFFLSAHEWQTAQQLGERYIIHIWTLVDPGPPPVAREEGPLVTSSQELHPHIPGAPPCAGGCRWQSAEIYLPVAMDQ